MKVQPIILLFTSLLVASCLRLDSQLFNDVKLTSYGFDSYTGPKELPDLPASYHIADSMKHLVTFTSTSSEGSAKLYGVYVGELNNIATDTVILYCHGNSKHMDNYWNRAKLLAHVGGLYRYGVLMFDYRGYGMSEGKPSEKNLYADTEAALKWLQSMGLTASRLVVYGYSLGSAPSCEISANAYSLKPFKLMLEAPFASSEVMVQDASTLALPGSFFTNAKINNAQKIKSITQPLLWMHGTADSFLSITTHGELVYNNHNGGFKKGYKIDGAEHNNLPTVWGYSNYLQAIHQFLLK